MGRSTGRDKSEKIDSWRWTGKKINLISGKDIKRRKIARKETKTSKKKRGSKEIGLNWKE